jgi:hypothetical protein
MVGGVVGGSIATNLIDSSNAMSRYVGMLQHYATFCNTHHQTHHNDGEIIWAKNIRKNEKTYCVFVVDANAMLPMGATKVQLVNL